MLTVGAIIKDGKVYFLDNVPFTGERRVLVTFLDEEARDVTMSRDKLDWMVDCIRNGKFFCLIETGGLRFGRRWT